MSDTERNKADSFTAADNKGESDSDRDHSAEEAAPQVIALSTAAHVQPARKRRGLFGVYDRPSTQVALVGLVCFLGPGMFNALSGIGGGGQVDRSPSVKSNIALYSVFAAGAFFSGTLHNLIGSKRTLFVGALGYCLYIGSYLSYNFNANGGFIIGAGAVLGLCAAFLWTAQGALMLSYPAEHEKGLFISIFWMIFNLGAVIGAAIGAALSWNSDSNTLSNGTYIAFLVLTGLGSCTALLLKSPSSMVRTDGTPVVVPQQHNVLAEFKGLWRVLRTDPWIILLFPLFLSSNWFYQYTFNAYNGALFTLRARNLNNLLYWLAQIIGSYAIGFVLDRRSMRRQTRAWVGWATVMVLAWVVWGGTYHVQTGYTRAAIDADKLHYRTDVYSSEYGGLAILYLCMGLMDSVLQCYSYWLFGAMSNDIAKLAHYAGFYKSIQSAGAAGAFGLDNDGSEFMTQLAVAWALNVAGLIIAMPVIWKRVTETTDALQEKTVEGREQEIKQIVEKVTYG